MVTIYAHSGFWTGIRRDAIAWAHLHYLHAAFASERRRMSALFGGSLLRRLADPGISVLGMHLTILSHRCPLTSCLVTSSHHRLIASSPHHSAAQLTTPRAMNTTWAHEAASGRRNQTACEACRATKIRCQPSEQPGVCRK